MKIKNVLLAFFVILATVVTMAPSQVLAQDACLAGIFNIEDVVTTRADLVQLAKDKQLPAVMMPVRGGEKIPAILMNKVTAPTLKGLLTQSIGTMVVHQKGYNNDHGLIRFGEIIADMDLPGHRNRGELHATGISWVGLNDYLGANSRYNRIEVVYSLTKVEMKTAQLYSLMRRAAIVRVRFTFGGGQQNSNLPNFLQQGGENCFGFCASSSIGYQVNEIKSRFNQMNLGDFDQIAGRVDVKDWITKVNESLLTADVRSPEALSPQLPMKSGIPESLANNVTFKAMTPAQQSEALNWLVGGTISDAYMALTRELGFSNTGNGFGGMYNSRATAVFVYDSNVTAEQFKATAYQSPGVFSTWTHQTATPY